MSYLHIEDDDHCVLKAAPTEVEFAAIDNLELRIFRFENGRFEVLEVTYSDPDEPEEGEEEGEGTWETEWVPV